MGQKVRLCNLGLFVKIKVTELILLRSVIEPELLDTIVDANIKKGSMFMK
jgi:hypothetical protein